MKTFKELTPEERSEIVEHMVATGSVQVLGKDGQWYGSGEVCSSRVYRIPVTKPSIDWSAVHTDYKWLARGYDGDAHLYRTIPFRAVFSWQPEAESRLVDSFSSYDPGRRRPCLVTTK